MKAVDFSTAFLVSLQAETTSLFVIVNQITPFFKDLCPTQPDFILNSLNLHYKKYLYLSITTNCP